MQAGPSFAQKAGAFVASIFKKKPQTEQTFMVEHLQNNSFNSNGSVGEVDED